MKPTARVARTKRESKIRKRLDKVRWLDEELGAHRLPAMLAMTHTEFDQLIGDHAVRAIDDALARRIERACRLSDGWLDS